MSQKFLMFQALSVSHSLLQVLLEAVEEEARRRSQNFSLPKSSSSTAERAPARMLEKHRSALAEPQVVKAAVIALHRLWTSKEPGWDG